VALMCSDLDLLSPFLGANISFVKFTQWSRQVKDGSLKVYDICSPSKVIYDHFHSPREKIFHYSIPRQQRQKMLVLKSAPDC
jgi:hypothetical protein